MKEQGLRYNSGKNRLHLVPTSAVEGIGQVLTYGANKYTVRNEEGKITVDGSGNWRKGMSWSTVIDSAKRHIAAFERGEDIDSESSCYHIDHALTNLAFLKEFYRIAPEFDDRLHGYLKPKRIALDVDDVICCWVGEWCKLHNIDTPTSWSFQANIGELFDSMNKDGSLSKFYANLPPLVDAATLPFEPICYISHRPVSQQITEAWLAKHKFPLKPVYITKERADKLQVCIDNKIDIFIDDNFETFVHLNKNGILCLLMDTPHNRRYDVGYRRIKDFTDLKNRFL